MRLVPTASVLRASTPAPTTVVYATPRQEVRERTGKAAFMSLTTTMGLPAGYAENTRILSNEELWQGYKLCPDVRASIEAIVRVVSTWDWGVEPVLDPSDPQYELALDVAAQAQHFLEAPNKDRETWQVLAAKFIRDLMVFDAMAVEHVFDAKGRLAELVALKGSSITPQEDDKQRLLGYLQLTPNSAVVYLDPEQLLYANLHPNTTAPGGLPLIETLISEIVTLMRQANHLMLDYDANEVPPGILVLMGLAGAAADRAVGDLQNKKGRDDKLRVITSPPGSGGDAKWVTMTPSVKDLDLKEVVKEVRRVVWRVFGVKPVSMGDTEATPRATAEVQVDAEESGLIRPILELLQGLINMRTLPLIVGSPDLANMVQFTFDWTKDLLPREAKEEAEGDAMDFDRGVLTVNERRNRRGLAPVEFGDVPLVKAGNTYTPLSSVVGDAALVVAPVAPPEDGVSDTGAGQSDGTAPGEAEGSGQAAGKALPAALRNAPKSVQRSFLAKRRARSRKASFAMLRRLPGGAPCEPKFRYEARSTLPSDWQAGSRFKGYRTIDLSRLGDQLLRYESEVTPLYRRARMDTVAAVRSYLGDGKLDNQELVPLASKVSSILDTLAVNWRAATEATYRDTAKVGRDAAVDFQGTDTVAQDWEAKGQAFCNEAMGYLVAPGGLIRDIGDQVLQVLVSSVRFRGDAPNTARKDLLRALRGLPVEDDVLAMVEGVDTATVLGAVRQVFDSEQFRIANWQGKLVDLGNEVMLSGLQEQPSATDANGDTTAPQEWMYEWVSVGDNHRCDTCKVEGTRGFRPVSQMTIQPGGATQCGGRCRCVLVFWLASEVKNGTAVSLSNVVT